MNKEMMKKADELKELIESSPADIYDLIKGESTYGASVFDENNTIIAVNDLFCSFYGYNHSEIIGSQKKVGIPTDINRKLSEMRYQFSNSDCKLVINYTTYNNFNEKITVCAVWGYLNLPDHENLTLSLFRETDPQNSVNNVSSQSYAI